LCELASATKEGRGGIAALEGFSFQFLLSLDAMVRASSSGDHGSVFLETLSDIAEQQGQHVVVAQVKRTLSSATVDKALDDLWKVDCLASTHTPDLQSVLRYKVLGSRSDLADIDRKIKNWKPVSPHADSRLTAFRANLTWECVRDPLTALAGSLVNLFAVADPFGLIERWLGALLAEPTTAGLAEAANRIAIELRGLEASQREMQHRFRLWSTDDRPPGEVIPERDRAKAVLTGQTPNRLDLTAGRFARRSIYADITGDAEKWLAEHAGADRELVRAYWISGRSGTGKSVALLHLLSSLHAADTQRVIIWLEGNSRRIGEAVRWSRPYVARGYQVIVAADDPFTAARQADLDAALIEARAEIESMVELHPQALRPMLIFCGPTEQAEAFIYEFGDQIRTRQYPLPRETEEDIKELRDWYRQRTGRGAPLEETSGVLIVQLFFEWAKGEKIGDFAKSFRRRLEDLMPDEERGPFHVVAEILAMNRLYALFPGAALKRELDDAPRLGAAFDRLEDIDSHFSFVPDLSGYRLTHPHLADGIYRTWFEGDANRRYRKSHLMRGIRAALSHHDSVSQKLAPLWAISRLTSSYARDHPENVARLALVREELREGLREIYIEQFANTAPPLAELPVWANLDSAFSLGLSPLPLSLIVEGVESASVDTPGVRLACHILVLHNQEAPRGLSVVKNLLEQEPAWKEWPKVALSYIRKVGISDLSPALIRYVRERPVESRELVNTVLHREWLDFRTHGQEILSAWFQKDRPYLEFQAGFLTDYIDRWGLDEDILETGRDFLVRFPKHPSWSHVWERLRRADCAGSRWFSTLATDWIKDFDRDKRGWGWVWSALWSTEEAAHDELTAVALRWIVWASHADTSWSRVWETLWLADTGGAQLRALGLSWLKIVDRGARSWSFVWELLWRHDAGAEDLNTVAIDWLEHAYNHPSWQAVWESLWTHSPGSADLRQTALAWLRDGPHAHPSWKYVWEPLWQDDLGADDLRTVALRWLEQAYDHMSWQDVWILLWTHCPGSADLRQTAVAWLRDGPPGHPSWKYVWEPLWQDDVGADDLRTLALQWLEQAYDHLSWQPVWISLWAHSPGSADLRQTGRAWLRDGPRAHPSWKYVWEPLWQDDLGADDLRTLALQWLGQAYDHLSWQHVWISLWAHSPGSADLRQTALAWLRDGPHAHPSWKYVWEPLWQDDLGADDLRTVALQWLEQAYDHLSWQHVWILLWTHAPGSADLRQTAVAWLRDGPRAHPSWKYVLEPLWQDDLGADDLRTLALQWLEQAYDHLSWQHVWILLWTHSPGSADLRQTGRAWLRDGPRAHPSWKYVWEPLWQDDLGADDLRTLALQWLGQTYDHLSWQHVWISLWTHSPGSADLRQTGLAWLRDGPHGHPSWRYVWGPLWQNEPGAEELREVAWTWLLDEFEHPNWVHVWEVLWAHSEFRSSDLAGLVGRWLEHVSPSHPSWGYAWRALWHSQTLANETSEALVKRGLEWMQAGDVSPGCWPVVWNFLWGGGHSNREVLSQVAIGLLSKHPPKDSRRIASALESQKRPANLNWQWADDWKKSWDAGAHTPQRRDRLFNDALQRISAVDLNLGGWTSVWQLLWANRELLPGAAETLRTCGKDWLEKVDACHPRWSSIWRSLWDHSNPDERARLVTTAFPWLEGPDRRTDWADVWIALWKQGGDQERLRAIVETGSRHSDMLSTPSVGVQILLQVGA
jgi:hypothetical protein